MWQIDATVGPEHIGTEVSDDESLIRDAYGLMDDHRVRTRDLVDATEWLRGVVVDDEGVPVPATFGDLTLTVTLMS